MEIQKVRERVYEIKPTGGMQVPVKIFANERILKKMEEDGGLKQACNVAALPGIVGQSIVLPDAHLGYGFSIGGVAAFDMEKGIISPGGIGFDINCLHPDTKILTMEGAWLRIADLEEKWESTVLSFKDEQNHLQTAKINCFMKRRTNDYLYDIRTLSGHTIRSTGKHPVSTQRGMVCAEDLLPDDIIHVNGFKGPKYERPTDEVILSVDDITRLMASMPVKSKRVLRQLKDILPLRYDSPHLSRLIKLVGYCTGDGNITFTERTRSTSFYGSPEDLREIKADIEALGFSCSRISTRTRKSSIRTYYEEVHTIGTEGRLASGVESFAILLAALGCPVGSKTHSIFRAPRWIWESPLWQKRLYLASFFGAELSKPSTLNKYNFYNPTVAMSKSETHHGNCVEFLNDLRQLLGEFSIETSQVVLVPGRSYNGRMGKTLGFRFSIYGRPRNLLRLYELVGIEYNRERKKLSSLAVGYLRFKLRILEQRMQVREDAQLLYAEGTPPRDIVNVFDSPYTGNQFIRHSLWSSRGGERLPTNFPSFSQYCEDYALGSDGLFLSRIADITLLPYSGWVYDLTMDDENHNFIADNIVVSNCGVRLLGTNLKRETVLPKMQELLDELFATCPVGVGRDGVRLTEEELKNVMTEGAQWAVQNGYGTEDDLAKCEAGGCLPEADPKEVPDRAVHRGKRQLGTVGAGNHFIEIQAVNQIFNPTAAEIFGLRQDQVVVMIHCGSRGFGHQICSDYIRMMEKGQPAIMKNLKDRDLIYAPLGSELAQKYWGAMNAAANFAFCNRHVLGHNVRNAFQNIFGEQTKVHTVYDVCHNIAKRETHVVEGKKQELMVHRKGATRAFPAGSEDIPEMYKEIGQPVLIPGSMGTASYVLVGAEGSLTETFGSTAHGAGRMMSRTKAKKNFPVDIVKEKLRKKGITIKAASHRGISEEAPGAYKDVDMVMDVSDRAGIAKKVARLVPLGVIKG